MAMAEVSVVPVGTGSTSVSGFVAAALQALREGFPHLRHELNPMGTVIEGDLEELLQAILAMHRAAGAAGAGRLVTTVKIDDRRDRPSSMEQKVRSVREKLSDRVRA